MAVDPWAIDASSGSPAYSGQELRLGTVTALTAGAAASLGARSGVRPSGSGTDLLVQAQSTPNMTVKVNPGVVIVQGSISATQGAYAWALDAVTNLTIAASHATLDRTDLVAVRIRDASVDTSGARDGNVVVITGTNGGGVPALPTDASYLTIAQISVVHAVTSITSGAITDKRPFTAALGGVIPCDANTEPAASAVPLHQLAYRTDLGLFRYSTGSTWRMLSPYRQVTTLGSTAGSVTFSGIPSTLRNIRILWTARTDVSANAQTMRMRINGDTGSNYRYAYQQAAGTTTIQTGFVVAFMVAGTIAGGTATSGIFSTGQIDIAGWDGPHSSYLGMNFQSQQLQDASNYWINVGGGHWNGSPPYTSITLVPDTAANFVAGCEFILEGWD